METLTKGDVMLRVGELIEYIHDGEIFIHPTDTIYGLGCKATDDKAVKKIRKLKERGDAPFSVWVPNRGWVLENCVVPRGAEKWLDQLPGPQTLIFKLKNKKALAKSVSPNTETIGIRIPNHWFHGLVERLGVPIVTTSANKTGRTFMTSLENVEDDIRNGVRFIVYEGEKKGRPSRIVNIAEGEKVIER